MPSIADQGRADFGGFLSVDAVGRASNGQLGPWTLSGVLSDAMPARTALVVLHSSGTITTATITVQASLDNVTWFAVQLNRIDTNTPGATLNYAGGGVIPLAIAVPNVPVRFLRVDVAALTGGGTVFADVLLSGD